MYICLHVRENFLLHYFLDIDECSNGNHNCKSNEYCVNMLGGFICKCASGFRTVNNACEGILYISCNCIASYLHTLLCIDINECSDSNSCDQLCTNTDGSYYCNCNEGYSLMDDGKSCEGMYRQIYAYNYKQQSFQASNVCI